MTCNGVNNNKHKEVDMEKHGDRYILSGNEYQTYKCPECGSTKKELINKWKKQT